ncbi:HAD family hydrolase [Dielma fastidiosa]|uniref:Cof-type HAD-IIB family hydrolase n=1 Tax=Dielma fastidiosa TaxID=1034346 RepID=A0AB35UPR0_9FIRM|nr:HAD family hydrolase [Dielma fastidiosa]MDY5169433.1 Cof-type HAD-IIB family hydrolase [Dielma fastidiosa]
MIKLIVSDLDGTLLQENHLMNQETINEIKKQMARGVDFMVTTGRDYPGVTPIFENTGIDPELILLNGAQYRDHGGVIKDNIRLSASQIKAVGEIFARFHVVWNVYTADGIASLFNEEENLDAFMETAWLDGFCTPDTSKETYRDFYVGLKVYSTIDELLAHEPDILKMEVHDGDREKIHQLQEALMQVEDIAIAISKPINIEVTHADAQKGIMLMKVIEKQGLCSDEVMVIGDSANDLSMLTRFKYSFAVANGAQAAIEAANYLTADNTDLGVVKAIRQLCKD